MILDKPTHARKYDGQLVPIDWPKGKIIQRLGQVFLVKQKKYVYHVVYGLQVKKDFSANEAFQEFAHCLRHQATCEGLLD